MKKLILLLILFPLLSFSQTIMSWNIQNLGETKFKNDSILQKIVSIISTENPDIVAVQEVVTSKYGSLCIEKIAKQLNYNFVVSKATNGAGKEKYAYIYKKSITLISAKLESKLDTLIDREPFVANFNYNNKIIKLINIHVVPSTKIPQNEIAVLSNFYNDGIILGDFNLTDKHVVYVKLLTRFTSPLYGQLTSLRRDGTLNKSYDHFLVYNSYSIESAKVVNYNCLYNRNKISDHLPIILKLK